MNRVVRKTRARNVVPGKLRVSPKIKDGTLAMGEEKPAPVKALEKLTGYQTSSRIRIIYTQVLTKQQNEWKDTHVLVDAHEPIALVMGIYLDSSLFDKGYRFKANFRVIRARTNTVQSNISEGKVEVLPQSSWFWISKTWDDAKDAVPGERGLYIFDPYFIIDTATDLGDGYYHNHGTSEFVTYDPYFFYIESLPES
jgi:hypothetical protein